VPGDGLVRHIAGERAMGAILTIQEVAERMRCEHRTVRRAIKSGELEAALIGGKWLVREEAVDVWFRSRCASSNPFSQPAQPAQARGRRASSKRSERAASVERLRAMEGTGG
jgi:excisionase family DNA binding protein